MLAYIARRLLLVIPTLFGIMLANFLIVQAAPGGPVDLMIARTRSQLESQGLGLELTQEAKFFLAEQGYKPELGARPLRRAIQQFIDDPLSERILTKEFRAGEIILSGSLRVTPRAASSPLAAGDAEEEEISTLAPR